MKYRVWRIIFGISSLFSLHVHTHLLISFTTSVVHDEALSLVARRRSRFAYFMQGRCGAFHFNNVHIDLPTPWGSQVSRFRWSLYAAYNPLPRDSVGGCWLRLCQTNNTFQAGHRPGYIFSKLYRDFGRYIHDTYVGQAAYRHVWVAKEPPK